MKCIILYLKVVIIVCSLCSEGWTWVIQLNPTLKLLTNLICMQLYN